MDATATAARLKVAIAELPRADTASIRAVRRRWSADLKATPAADVLALATAYEREAGQTGKWVAYELIRFHPGAFAGVSEAEIAGYASRCASWFAVDAFGTILAGPLWAKGRLDDGLVKDWAGSPSRWGRRTALVATVGLNTALAGQGGDASRTLAVCRALAADRDDMVEKGLSWALRELSKRDRPSVEAFMAEMAEVLPARVLREVRHKLATGLKSGRRR
ncbi:MAG TPA: DNA alkylation repair protein [Phenylobacterium sp.]